MSNKELYKGNFNKVFTNNLNTYSTLDKSNKSLNKYNIKEKILNIINSNDFIYQTKVKIILNNDTIERKIVGLVDNNLLTLDNEYIPLSSIIDIYKEKN